MWALEIAPKASSLTEWSVGGTKETPRGWSLGHWDICRWLGPGIPISGPQVLCLLLWQL